jgi:hypothetical protein
MAVRANGSSVAWNPNSNSRGIAVARASPPLGALELAWDRRRAGFAAARGEDRADHVAGHADLRIEKPQVASAASLRLIRLFLGRPVCLDLPTRGCPQCLELIRLLSRRGIARFGGDPSGDHRLLQARELGYQAVDTRLERGNPRQDGILSGRPCFLLGLLSENRSSGEQDAHDQNHAADHPTRSSGSHISP